MKIINFFQAQQFLYRHIPKNSGKKFPGSLGLERTRHFLALLKNPQNKLKVIHIAGTSGKGSTAYLTSTILNHLGFNVGLHVSPHVVDIRERFQINNQLISKKEFCQYLNEIIPFIEKMKSSPFGSPTYFAKLVVLTFFISYKRPVDCTLE